MLKPAYLPLRASAWADPSARCECFSLCHPGDAERFYERLDVRFSLYASRRTLTASGMIPQLPGATYYPSTFTADEARLFDEAKQLPYPLRNRGITRAEGAPRLCAFPQLDGGLRDADGDALPAPLTEIARTLLERNLLRKPPRQCSVNFYHQPRYEMVPHKDGYSDQAAITSLGSDAVLDFWHAPMDAAEKLARDMLHGQHSGTAVHDDCLERPPHCSVWMEPGSVLVLEGAALSDFVHGLASRAEDRFDGETIANAPLVSLPALRARLAAATSADGVEQRSGAAAEGEPAAQVAVPRRQRVSVVMWTAYTPQPAAAAPT